MDGMLYDLRNHYLVNFSSSEIEDITEAVKILLKRYMELINKTESFNILDITMTGSMAEWTRIWSFDTPSDQLGGTKNATKYPVVEYDFLARLAINENLDIKTSDSCGGHMHIFKLHKNDNLLPSSDLQDVSVSTVDVEKRFQHELMNAVSNLCNCNTTVRGSHGIETIKRKHKRGCRNCVVKMESGSLTIASESEFGNSHEKGCNLIFKWESSARSLQAKDIQVFSDESVPFHVIYILIDLLPSYGLHRSECLLSNDGSRNLVPKVCHVCKNSLCWRISNSREEKDIIQHTSEHHRSVFGALKVLVLLAFPRHGDVNRQIPSYHIKTSFLHHISSCNDRFVTTFSCLRNILDRLSFSFQVKILRNFFTDHNLLKEHRYRSDNFCQKYSKCFDIMKQILLLGDLLGDKNCRIDVMYPYIRNVDTMYISLLQNTEGLGDLQEYIRNFQDERESVTLLESKIKPKGEEMSYSNQVAEPSTSRNVHPQQTRLHTHGDFSNQHRRKSSIEEKRETLSKWATNTVRKDQERATLERVTKKVNVKKNKKPKHNYETVAAYLCMIM